MLHLLHGFTRHPKPQFPTTCFSSSIVLHGFLTAWPPTGDQGQWPREATDFLASLDLSIAPQEPLTVQAVWKILLFIPPSIIDTAWRCSGPGIECWASHGSNHLHVGHSFPASWSLIDFCSPAKLALGFLLSGTGIACNFEMHLKCEFEVPIWNMPLWSAALKSDFEMTSWSANVNCVFEVRLWNVTLKCQLEVLIENATRMLDCSRLI